VLIIIKNICNAIGVSAEANFHFQGPKLSYFKLGALLEGLQRQMSYKLSIRVLVTFTEKVVPIEKHITMFLIPVNIRNKNSHNETDKKCGGLIHITVHTLISAILL